MNLIRIKNLFRAYFIEDKKTLLIISIIIFLVAALQALDGVPNQSAVVPFACVLFIAGMFFHSPLKKKSGTHIFSLPVTTAEKLMNAIVVIITAYIAFILIAIAGAYVGYYLIRPVLHIGSDMYVTNGWTLLKWGIPGFNEHLFLSALLSVFLFGSIYFRGRAMLKTIGAGVGFLFGIAIYFLALLAIVFRGENYNLDDISINIAESSFFQNHYYIFPILIITFFLSLTYLRLRETEV